MISRRYLKMQQVSARWVPHHFNWDQRMDRVAVAEKYLKLKQYEDDEGDYFLNHIPAINETWLLSYQPILKSQSSKWHTPGSPRPGKF